MVYQFDDYRLDTEQHQLFREGEAVKLTGLSFRMLKTLVEAAPALVSHDQMIDAVWGENRIVTPENLLQRVKKLRQSLGDDAQNPRYIEGIRGEGFRLVPEVNVISTPEEPDTAKTVRGRTGWNRPQSIMGLVAIGALVAAVVIFTGQYDSKPAAEVAKTDIEPKPTGVQAETPRATVAVLPFANLSGDPESEYFTNGIHDDLLSRLARIRDIRTISRTSVMAYRGSSKSLQVIAGELGVETILEGGVQYTGEEVRVNMQLIDAQTDASLWADSFTRELTAAGVFDIQSEITGAVVEALQAILTEEERVRLRQQPTENLEALEAYYRGTEFAAMSTAAGYELASMAFSRAIELDPGFAAAYSQQALALLNQVWYASLPNEEQLEKAWPLIEKATELDPLSSDAFNALGMWMQRQYRAEEAETAYRKAIALGPNNADARANYGNLKQWLLFDAESAIELYEQAIALDPQSTGHLTQLAESLDNVGRNFEAIELLEKSLETQPDFVNTHRVLSRLYAWTEFRFDKAIQSALRAHELDPSQLTMMEDLAILYWYVGDAKGAAAWAKRVAESSLQPDKASFYEALNALYSLQLEAGMEILRSIPKESEWGIRAEAVIGRIEVAMGRPEEALALVQPYMEKYGALGQLPTILGVSQAVEYYKLLRLTGNEDKAARVGAELEHAFTDRPMLGYLGYHYWEALYLFLSGETEQSLASLGRWIDAGGATMAFIEETRSGFRGLVGHPEFDEMVATVDSRLAAQRETMALSNQ